MPVAGFTGTRTGMSVRQALQFREVIRWLRPGEFHHGGAVGADMQAAAALEAMLNLVVWQSTIVVHPAGRQPLMRNRAIVAACDILIAAPETDTEQLRSGTWATVRYARQAVKPVIMLSRGN